MDPDQGGFVEFMLDYHQPLTFGDLVYTFSVMLGASMLWASLYFTDPGIFRSSFGMSGRRPSLRGVFFGVPAIVGVFMGFPPIGAPIAFVLVRVVYDTHSLGLQAAIITSVMFVGSWLLAANQVFGPRGLRRF